jgi:hypothetical protein
MAYAEGFVVGLVDQVYWVAGAVGHEPPEVIV